MKKKHIPIVLACSLLSLQVAKADSGYNQLNTEINANENEPIKGRIIDADGFGVPDAEVRIVDTDYVVYTDADGFFNFNMNRNRYTYPFYHRS